MPKNSHLLVAIVLSALAATKANAEIVSAVAPVGDLASIQSEMFIGKAKLVQEQVYADLRKYRSDG